MRTCYNVSPKPAVQNTTPKSDENKKVITKKTILGRRYVKVPDTSLKQVGIYSVYLYAICSFVLIKLYAGIHNIISSQKIEEDYLPTRIFIYTRE